MVNVSELNKSIVILAVFTNVIVAIAGIFLWKYRHTISKLLKGSK